MAQTQTDKPTSDKPWTMEQCINYAWTSNLQIKQAEISQKISKNNLTQSKANFFPSVTGSASNTYNYGLTVNPFTNTFANSEVTDESFNISGNLTLFGGFQNINSLKENELNYQASTMDLQSNKNNIALNVAQDYLQVLLSKELLAEAMQQQTVLQAQVERTSKLVDAGSQAKSNLLDVESQEANGEVNVVNAKTQLDIATLNLAQLLDLDSAQMLTIVVPQIDIPESSTPDNPEVVFTKALTNQPDVESAHLKWESAEKSAAVSRGSLYPKLLFIAGVGTGFSTANVNTVGENIASIDTIRTTAPGVSVLFPNYSYVTEIVPFTKQLQNNKNESFGFQLTIPIFNKLQSNISYQNAKLNEQNAYYSYQISTLTLRKTIQQAYADALGALDKYHAEEKSVASLQESFNYTKSRFDVGVATALDFNTAQTNLAKAESDLLQAKYNYVFKVKVLDFYEGKPLKL